MADENLSFAVVFEEVNRLVNGVRDATAEIAGMKDAATAAAQGLDDAARSALAGADAFSSVATAASEAGGALQDIPTSVDLAMDPEPLERTATAAEGAASEINSAVAAAESMKSEGELAADAMQALGFATAEEEKSARLASDAMEALAGNVGQVGDATKEAAAATTGASRAFSGLGTIAKASAAVAGGLLAVKTASDVGRFIQDSMKGAVREFLEAERATTQLSAALASMNKFSLAAVSSVRAFASEIQRTTTFTDDAVVSAAALIAQVGQLSGPALQRATQAAVELSAVLGRDLNQAALLIARGAQGATESFSRLGIVVRGAGTDAEKFDRILDQIATKFGGRARAEALSFGGAIQQLRNSWNEFLETVGGSITIFEPVIRKLTAALQKANEILGIETPASALDGTAALNKFADGYKAIVELTGKPLPVSSFASAFSKEDLGAPKVSPIDKILADMQKDLDKTLLAVKFTVEGGDLDQIADLDLILGGIEARARSLDNSKLTDMAMQLRFVFNASKQVAEQKIELQGVDQTIIGLEQIIDLAAKLQGFAGVKGFKVIDTAEALKNATEVQTVSRIITESVGGIEKAIADALEAGEDIPVEKAADAFKAIDEARQAIIEKYGQLQPDLERVLNTAQGRLRAIAQRFDIPQLKAVFTTEGLEDLLHFAEQGRAEVEAFGALIRQINAAAETDPLTLINTEELIAGAKSIQDLVPVYEAAMARLQQAISFKPIGTTAPAAPAVGVFDQANRSVKELEASFGGLSTEAQAAFDAAISGAKDLAVKFPEIQGAADQTKITVSTAGDVIAAGLQSGFLQILQGVESFSEGLKKIFRSVVDTILAELARAAAAKIGAAIGGFFLNLFVPGLGVAWDTALVGLGKATAPTTEPPPPIKLKTPKIETPELPPIELPPLVLEPFRLPRLDLPPLELAPIDLEAIELPPLTFTPFELPAIELPQIEFPQAELRKLTLPRIETQPIETERFLFPTIEAAPTEPASVEFSRFLSSQATREAALSRETARIRRLSRERPIERIQPQFNIQATDALSVRRQLTAGALRREMERALRRSDF